MRAIYEAGELCDGTVILGDRQFPVCRMLLSAASPFFKSAFMGGFRESAQCSVTLDPTLPADCVDALLKHAHVPVGSGITLNPESFLSTADQLGFSDLIPAASRALIDTLSPGNLLARLVLADRYELADLLTRGVELFSEHAVDICGSPEFASLLPQSLLSKVLSHQDTTASELPLFEGLLAWTRHDSARAVAFDELLEHVRLPELGIQYLISSVVHAEEVVRSSRARQLVQEAMAFLTVPEQRLELTSPRMESRRNLPAFLSQSSGGIAVTYEGSAIRFCRRSFSSGDHGSAHCALSSEKITTPKLSWTVRVIKGRANGKGWVAVGVIAKAVGSAGVEMIDWTIPDSCYAWGGRGGQMYVAGKLVVVGQHGWVEWRTDDTAQMTLDVVAGTLSMKHTRQGVTSTHQLTGLDPSKEWRLYVNLVVNDTAVEITRARV